MHELSITSSVVEICAERARGNVVRRVTLEIGQLTAVLPDAVRFCFDVCAAGTPLEGAELQIVRPAGRARCRDCGAEVAMTMLIGRCECGCVDLELVAGQELKVKEMELA